MSPIEYRDKLLRESENGFHKKKKMWVDEKSSVYRALTDAEEAADVQL